MKKHEIVKDEDTNEIKTLLNWKKIKEQKKFSNKENF